jgi:urease accessory protein
MVAGQSAVVTARSGTPLKILVPHPRGPSVSACLSTYGGGLVAGDEIHLAVAVDDGARCHLGTQASTKIYRNPTRLPCGHDLTARLGRQSLLALLPDPVQAFDGSLYRQRQQFHLEPDSGLVLVDWLTSGRSECGERWAFARYESRNEVFVGGQRVALDSILLDPADGPITGAGRMGRFNCLALLALFGGALKKPAARLLQNIAGRPVPGRAALLIAASPVAAGVLVRLAGEQVEEVREELHQLLDFLPEVLHDDPRRRKW